MKKNIVLSVIATSIILFSSCKKDNQDPNDNTVSNKVKTYREDLSEPGSPAETLIFNVNYDASGRIISLVATNEDYKFLFAYPAPLVYTMDIYESNELQLHEDIYLNSNSLFDSTLQYVEDDTSTEKYFYDSGNRLVKLNEYDYVLGKSILFNTTNYQYDSNGNMVRSEDTDGDIQAFEYYPDLIYALPVTGLFQNVTGTQKQQLIKKAAITTGGQTTNVNFTYTFDSSNRISTEKTVYEDGTIGLKTYTYY